MDHETFGLVEPHGDVTTVHHIAEQPLDASMLAIVGFRDVLTNLLTTVRANWAGTIVDTDTEFLHELRIALRCTRSVIRLGKHVLPDDVRSRFGDEFAWLAGLTGPTRDLDAYLAQWDDYVGNAHGSDGHDGDLTDAFERLRGHVLHRRAVEFTTLRSALHSERAVMLVDDWAAALGHLGPNARRSAEPLGDVIGDRLRASHGAVARHGRRIDSKSKPAALHDLRKDAKRLRYLVDCFGGLFEPSWKKDYLKPLKRLQDNLGAHQDAVVHRQELTEIVSEIPAGEIDRALSRASRHVLSRLDKVEAKARTRFGDRFTSFDSHHMRTLVRRARRSLRSA